MNKALRIAVVGIGLMLASGAIYGVPARPSAELQPAWTEFKWPFPVDQWGIGRAFVCKPAACGVEVNVYLRPKIGFCKCATGVDDDDELERVGDHAGVQIILTRQRDAVEVRVRVHLRVPALDDGERGHLLAALAVTLEPARVRDRHALSGTAEPVWGGKLRRSLGVGARQVLVGAAGVVHGPPDHRIRADPGQQRVDGLLHRTADIDGLHLDVPAQTREF